MPTRNDNIMNNLYKNINFPGSFTGITNLKREIKEKKKKVTAKQFNKFLLNNRTYTLFRPRRSKYRRLKTIPLGYLSDVEMDLADFSRISQHNRNYNFLLVCIDVLSRRVFFAPVKKKDSENMTIAMQKVLSQMDFQPISVFTDRGTEFLSKSFKKFLEERGIKQYTSQNQTTKAAMAERAIRNVKERLYKYFSEYNTLNWIDVIDKFALAINHTVCRAHNMKPIDISEKNQQEVWDKLYSDDSIKNQQKQRFKEFDFVRIPYKKLFFEKGHLANWSDSIKQIAKCYNTNPLTYSLYDENGNLLKERFYAQQLVKVDKNQDTSYRVEKVLKERINKKGVKEFFVKWVNYDSSYNCWVPETNFEN